MVQETKRCLRDGVASHLMYKYDGVAEFKNLYEEIGWVSKAFFSEAG